MEINDHILMDNSGKRVPFRKSANIGSRIEPRYLIIHYTAGASAESSVDWLTSAKSGASAHLVIGRDGSITQLVPFSNLASHTGPSSWESYTGMDTYSIGIELDNVGRLKKYSNGWRTNFQKKPEKHYILDTHKFDSTKYGWQTYPQAQMDVLTEVAIALVNEYRLVDILGHDDICPRRKWDPGPAFPMHSFRSKVMGRKISYPICYKTLTELNIRCGPGTAFDKIKGSPLPRDCFLNFLERHENWLKVLVLDHVEGDMDIEGWVHSRYCIQLRPSEIVESGYFGHQKDDEEVMSDKAKSE